MIARIMMNSLITFIISIAFLGLVIWENRLHSQLGFLASQRPDKVTKDFIRVIRQEKRLNWILCILAIIVVHNNQSLLSSINEYYYNY